jgi:hypothetical protein
MTARAAQRTQRAPGEITGAAFCYLLVAAALFAFTGGRPVAAAVSAGREWVAPFNPHTPVGRDALALVRSDLDSYTRMPVIPNPKRELARAVAGMLPQPTGTPVAP